MLSALAGSLTAPFDDGTPNAAGGRVERTTRGSCECAMASNLLAERCKIANAVDETTLDLSSRFR